MLLFLIPIQKKKLNYIYLRFEEHHKCKTYVRIQGIWNLKTNFKKNVSCTGFFSFSVLQQSYEKTKNQRIIIIVKALSLKFYQWSSLWTLLKFSMHDYTMNSFCINFFFNKIIASPYAPFPYHARNRTIQRYTPFIHTHPLLHQSRYTFCFNVKFKFIHSFIHSFFHSME